MLRRVASSLEAQGGTGTQEQGDTIWRALYKWMRACVSTDLQDVHNQSKRIVLRSAMQERPRRSSVDCCHQIKSLSFSARKHSPYHNSLEFLLYVVAGIWTHNWNAAVYQHLSPGRPLSLSRGGTGSSSNIINEAPEVCWGKQACLCADTFPSAHSLFWVAAKRKSIKWEDHSCLAWGSKTICTAALLLLSPFCLSDSRINAEPSKSHHTAALARAYILVRHFPVRPLAIGHHLPHYNAVAPDVTGRCEFAEGNCFRRCPSNGDLPSLNVKEIEKNSKK